MMTTTIQAAVRAGSRTATPAVAGLMSRTGKSDAFAALTTDQPDPVMSADADLDGSVTWEEFRALVAQNFAEFDKDHAGFITKSEVQTLCARSR